MFDEIGRTVIGVADQDEALTFYRDVLGFGVLHDETVDGPLLVVYTAGLDAVRRRLAEHGVEIWAERDDAAGRSLHFRDVDGNVLIAAER